MIPNLTAMDRPVEKPKGLSRRALYFGVAGILVIGALAVAIPTLRTWSNVERSVEATKVRIAPVERGELIRDASAQGKIVAALHPTLFAPASGIVALAVKAGASVKKGTVLARIESPELRSRLQQEKAALLSMESALDRERITARQGKLKTAQQVDLLTVKLQAAHRLLERAQRTYDEGLLNKTDYEKAKDDLQVAQLELKNAQESGKLDEETASFEIRDRESQTQRQASITAELQRQVEQLMLVAPFDGIVASVAVQDRDAVPANAPVLTVVDLSQFEVEISLPENYGAEATPGTEARILYEGKEFAGRVTAMSPEITDSQVKGTVAFDGETPAGLRQSQRVSVRLVFERKPDVLKLPRGPFLETGGGRQAYVLDGGVARLREIEVGAVSIAEVEILSGLERGDRVIISDTSELQNAKSVLIR